MERYEIYIDAKDVEWYKSGYSGILSFSKKENGKWCKWEDAEEERKKAYKQGYNDSVKALIKIIKELSDSALKNLEEM